MQGTSLQSANTMLAGQAAAGGGQQMVGVRLPNGQVIVMPASQAMALAAQQQQQLAALQQQQLLSGVRPTGQGIGAIPQSNAAQLAAVTAIQQRMAQGGQAAGAAGAVRPAVQQQQLLLALQQQQQHQQAVKQQAVSQAPEPPQLGFTQEQLVVLKEQIMLFKAVKKGTEPVTQEALQKCKPPPLPPPPPRPAAVLPAAVSGLGAGVKPLAPVVATSGAANPAALAALQQQLQRQQQQPAALAQHALQQRNLAAVAQQRALAPGGAASVGRPGQPQASAGGGAAAAPAEAPVGPTTPPMDVPVRRPAGPLLGMLPPADLAPGAGAPPSLNVDVPRMLLREFHHRLNRAKGKRTHELEALLRRKDLPVGHGRSPEGLPGRAAVLLELRKLRLWNVQMKVRSLLEREEEEIVTMPDKLYKGFQKTAAKYKQQLDLTVQQRQHERWERLYIERMQYKKLATDRFVMYRDMHLMRNKQLGRLHERLARELNKQKMDDNDRRLEALKANDFEAYKELLRQTYGPLSDDDRFAEVERFLNETEEYINKLTKKLVQYKAEEQAGEAVAEAVAEARMMELSEEEVKVRAAAVQQEHMATNELLTQVHTLGGDAQSRFTQLAHNIREKVTRQPAYLKPPKGGKLREYQMVGLEWMVSLYNNKLNGILADEMGLGKTVQVMALLAYLYEFKQNYGPHLIIVPNAVIVNWKAELNTWLPDFRCVYYTGNKDERALKFQNEVQSMQFNILVTTYETIMRDRSKLSKLEWKYIIIDEAQRMKDRESKLSQDLNKFTTARRLLLTGTPLQNELKELWSLLNLLLPDVFNDSNTFSEWFTKFLGVDTFGDAGAGGASTEAAALDREKKVLVVNRLHQILSPFMLRRMVKDVEQQLPEKVTVTVKCPMSAYQSAIYNWIKTTNTVRVDPAHRRAAHGQRTWEPLQNKVMELRKVCNHPRLCYPDSEHFWGNDVVRTCGKMFWLDRMLVKLHASGHRVLLFSTMTRMLDTVEFYLNWRQVDKPDGSGEKMSMQSRRIDGATSLEQREAAIQEFNRPGSDVFIFLLSIRAAGRGLNLQTSDTVIIYDPDPNPKNEEQAIARSHRIGQTKEVRVFHLEAISDPAECFPPPVYQPRRGDVAPASGAAGAAAAVTANGQQSSGSALPNDTDDQLQPSMFADSIESLMRNIIQKQKIDMANEVIDAGRFDMQTTNEERRKTLEEMLLDEDRLQTATNEAPTLESFNRQLARSGAEFELFQRLDREAEWPGELYGPEEVPEYLCYAANEAQEVLQITDRRPARIGMLATAERKAQGLSGQPEPSGRGRGRGAHKPPKPSRLGMAPGQQQQPEMHAVLSVSDLAGPSGGVSMRPSQSMGSFLGGTSLVSLGEEGEGEEEVVGGTASGLYEDIEEEVVDDRNIDEEFEKVLEQAEDVPSKTAGSGLAAAASVGSVGVLEQQPVGAAASSRGAAGLQQQQQQQHVEDEQQQVPAAPRQPMQYHVTFQDDQAAPAAAAPQAIAAGGEDDDWEDVDKQQAAAKAATTAVTNGVPDSAAVVPGMKRSWGQLDAGTTSGGHGSGYTGSHAAAADGGLSAGMVWPSASGAATSSGMPSSSQGGTKKIRLSFKRSGASPSLQPQDQQQQPPQQ